MLFFNICVRGEIPLGVTIGEVRLDCYFINKKFVVKRMGASVKKRE